MTVEVKNQRVKVTRNGQTFEATTEHNVHLDVKAPDGSLQKGPYLGTAIRLDSGHVLYAQPAQMEAI